MSPSVGEGKQVGLWLGRTAVPRRAAGRPQEHSDHFSKGVEINFVWAV